MDWYSPSKVNTIPTVSEREIWLISSMRTNLDSKILLRLIISEINLKLIIMFLISLMLLMNKAQPFHIAFHLQRSL